MLNLKARSSYGLSKPNTIAQWTTRMADITMCKRFDCPLQDNCWRLNAPPDLTKQSYQMFEIDMIEVECEFYIPQDELEF